MKRFSILLAATLLVGATAAQAEVRFGIDNETYAPFYYKDASGKWVGWEIELMDAVCTEMKESCSMVESSWDGLIPGLTANKFDVIWSSMSITDERKKTIDFTDKYYNTPSKLIGYKDSKLGTTPEDVAGKTIGVQVSTIQANYFDTHYKGKADEKTYGTLDEAFQDLAAGRIDYVFGDAIPLLELLKSDTGKDCCEDKGNVADDPAILGTGIGGGIRKGDTELAGKFNAAIAAVRASGKYEEISKKYFSFDPYGN